LTDVLFQLDFQRRHHPTLELLDVQNTTSATTYKVQIVPENGATAVVNKSSHDGDYTYHGRFASTITLMEVQG
jgi:hypothetical protein